ncbi:MAG: DsbE family thiol:disulfide interchange protein [Rhizobiaceae bacterium]|nr:DsbE family thiol:disulfide interchange protein [Rhizobiaceae bacterium]
MVEKRSSPMRLLLLAAPLILFGALAAVFYVQLVSGKDTSELPSALIGKPVPVFNLDPLADLNADGVAVPGLKSEDLLGKISLVNIFASWCAPCRAEHPVLMKLAENKELNLVGINYKDQGENARRFLGTLGNPYSRVGVDRKGRTAIEWGFYGIPETLLVDPDGIVRHKIVGPISAKKFEALKLKVRELMDDKQS